MALIKRVQSILALPLVLVMLLTIVPVGTVNANIVATDQLLAARAAQAERKQVDEFLVRDDVREQLQSMGVDPDEARDRVAALSDAEVQKIAGRLKELPAGEGVVGPIVGALVLIFLVLLITDLLCLTNVFPFARCASR